MAQDDTIYIMIPHDPNTGKQWLGAVFHKDNLYLKTSANRWPYIREQYPKASLISQEEYEVIVQQDNPN